MLKKIFGLWPALWLLCLSFSYPQGHEQKTGLISLTLKECISCALANNLDLSVEAFNPDINDASISETKEKYLPEFSLSYAKQNQTQLGGWGLEGTNYLFKMDQYTFNLSQRVATGGSVTLSFANSMTDTARAYQVINPIYSSSIQLSLSQPLLKGFGPRVNRIETLRAVIQRDISISGLKSRVIQTIYDVEEAYWNLYYVLENLRVQESSLKQSREILKKNQEAARIGTKSAIEVLNSEAEVAQYEDGLILAQLQGEQNEARLKKILNFPSGGLVLGQSLILLDKPVVETKKLSYEEALNTALEQRPEILQSEKELENNSNDIAYYKNRLLPQLDLTFSMWSPGQSGIKTLYQDDNPFTGIIVGKIEGSRMEALKEALKRTYKNWSVNLTLDIPLANVFSRASLVKAKMEREQKLSALEKQKRSIAYEVAESIKSLQNAARKIKSSTASRELQEKRVQAEMEKYQLGLGSSDWLYSYQRQLLAAKTSEIRAFVDYKLAAANLERIMGTSLQAKNLKFRDYEF